NAGSPTKATIPCSETIYSVSFFVYINAAAIETSGKVLLYSNNQRETFFVNCFALVIPIFSVVANIPIAPAFSRRNKNSPLDFSSGLSNRVKSQVIMANKGYLFILFNFSISGISK